VAASARSFAALLVAFVAFFPASGAFVGLTQSALMDADPARRAQHMARWTLAGSAGSVAGPLLLAAVVAAGGSWRTAYLLIAGAAAAAAAYPAFLLVPGLGGKLAVLAVLSMATAPWYPVIQAELYRSLPGRSGIAVSLTSAAGLLGGLGPLAVGLLAQRFGLAWAVTGLAIAPAVVLVVAPRRRPCNCSS